MRKFNALSAVVVACTLALAGCGGDDDSTPDDSTPEVTLTSITEANAAQVSAVVFRAASVLFDVASSTGGLPVGAVVSGTAPSGGIGLVGFAAQQFKAALDRPLTSASGALGVVYEETFNCSGGGTILGSWDDADNNNDLSAGDTLTLSFTNCVEEGVTSNGVASFKLTVVSETVNSAQSTFDNLRINDGTDEIVANGGFDLTISQSPGVSETYEIAGDRLTSTFNGDAHTLTAFTGSAVTNYTVGAVTYTFKGGVTDSSNNISVLGKTGSAFVVQSMDDYPGSGVLLSTGAGTSQARLEAISSTRVRISADPEGDGSFTDPVQWDWSALDVLPD